MLQFSLIGAAMLAATVAVHAAGSFWWVCYLMDRFADRQGYWPRRLSLRILIATALVLVALHIIQVVMWAAAYRVIVPLDQITSFESALYFSFVTFTTVGYGDITLGEGYRLLSGIEATNGILLFGWTTAMLFSVVQRNWQIALGRREA